MRKNALISQVNSKWWQCVNEHFDISVLFKKVPAIKMQRDLLSIKIIVPRDNCAPEFFGYEIGRLYLLAKNWHIHDFLQVRYAREPLLSWALAENIFYWLGVQLEALILLPLLNGSLPIHSLQADYISPFNSPYINEQLEKGFISSHLRNHTIGLFIQRYFVLEVGRYFYGDLEEDKKSLSSLCHSLFSILQQFSDLWALNAQEEKLDQPANYKIPIAALVHSLGQWCTWHFHSQPKVLHLTHHE